MSSATDILIVDDQPANLSVLSRLLTDEGYRVRAVSSGERALEASQRRAPDCILLDVNMPGMDGFETCERLQQMEDLRSVPVVFITANDDVANKVRGFSVGGRDYVTKPFQAEEVLARVRNQLRIRELEGALREQNTELAEAKLRTEEAAALKNRVTAMLVHDLRSPLTVVGMVLEGMVDDESMSAARLSFTRVQGMLQEMLELARAEDTEILREHGRIDLIEVLDRCVRPARQLGIPDDISVDFDAEGQQIWLEGDQSCLERVFTNLLENAVKYTPTGKSVRVTAAVQPGEGVESGLQFATVSVIDSGPGIPSEELPFIFDPYRQGAGAPRREGVGLGLAIAARVVARHGGRVRAFSRVGVGTEIRVQLPIEGGS